MNVLFIGDIFGKKGRLAISELLPKLKNKYHIDLTIANAENTTHGRSLSVKHFNALQTSGIDYFTFGNHTWHLDEIKTILSYPNTVRPLNLVTSCPYANWGQGSITFKFKNLNIRLTNLLGSSVECKEIQTNPFLTFNELLKNDNSHIHIVDFHCETTSEKNAFFLTFAGKVSAIVCTHTHVQTADERIYKNTAYISDVGMTGGSLGVIGAEAQSILDVFNGRTSKFRLSPSNTPYQFNGVVISFNKNNHPTKIKRIFINEK